MVIRSKFMLAEVKISAYNPSCKELIFRAHYDATIPEDQRFYDATPAGEFKMLVNNPVALAFFELGKYYYFDATEVTQ